MADNLPRKSNTLALLLMAATFLAILQGCGGSSQPEIVVYAALDREFSEPILQDFEKETGIRVLTKFDVESTKTVGLASAIAAEKNRPRCDLFWNNEILHTLRLEKQGLLEVYRSPAAAVFPTAYLSPGGHWHGLAARARVLIVNTQVVPKDQMPKSIRDLADPRWKEKVGMAKPLFGTTGTHAAVLFATWGDEKAKTFFSELQANKLQILSGNKQVAQAVGRGQIAFGITDTDDAVIERDRGSPVEIVFPDQEEDGLGTLFIPNTLALIKGAPHAAETRKLIDFLLAPAVEERLAHGESGQFPVNPAVKTRSRVVADDAKPIRWMAADFPAAADKWEAASKFLEQEFLK